MGRGNNKFERAGPQIKLSGDDQSALPASYLVTSACQHNLRNDEGGLPLTGVAACTYTVAPGHVWLISTYSPLSFDSRYLGPVPISSIRGTVKPLWTIE